MDTPVFISEGCSGSACDEVFKEYDYFLPAAENSIPGGLSPVEAILIIPLMNEALMISLSLCLRSLAVGRDPATAAAKCYFALSCCIPFCMNFQDIL